jgi:hypothetical protein
MRGHGDVLGLQRKGDVLYLWVNWTHYSDSPSFVILFGSR